MVYSEVTTAAFSHCLILLLVTIFVGLTKLVCLKTTMEALSLPTTCLASTSHGFLHGHREFRKVEKVPIWGCKFTQKARQTEGQIGVCLQIMGPHSLSQGDLELMTALPQSPEC